MVKKAVRCWLMLFFGLAVPAAAGVVFVIKATACRPRESGCITRPPDGPGLPTEQAQLIDGLAYPAGYFSNNRFRRYLLLIINEGICFGNEERDTVSEGFPIYL